MQKCLILAESGGTKTDWKVWLDADLIYSFTTGSFHPDFVTDEQIKEIVGLIPQLKSSDTLLRIYSAGCYREEGKLKLKKQLSFLPVEVEIRSDVDAAVEATRCSEGWVCILGTGSVLAHFDKGKIQLFGGLGWENGDEGSGFYFGKLVVEALENGAHFNGINEQERHELLSMKGDKISKYRFASLCRQLSYSETKYLHERNIQLFVMRYLLANNVKNITVVGGYASAFENVLRVVFEANNVKISDVISRPIDRL